MVTCIPDLLYNLPKFIYFSQIDKIIRLKNYEKLPWWLIYLIVMGLQYVWRRDRRSSFLSPSIPNPTLITSSDLRNPRGQNRQTKILPIPQSNKYTNSKFILLIPAAPLKPNQTLADPQLYPKWPPASRRTARSVATWARAMAVSANTGSIPVVAVTPEACTTTGSFSTSTILGILGKLVCVTSISYATSSTAPSWTSTSSGQWFLRRWRTSLLRIMCPW